MTVIAYRDGIMAADGASWQGEVIVAFETRKINRTAGGWLWACSGARDDIDLFREWIEHDRSSPPPKPREDDFSAIVVRPDGEVTRFYGGHPYQVPATFVSAGAHDEFLNAVMIHGGSAEEAVRLAIKHCPWAGGEVQVERLHPA